MEELNNLLPVTEEDISGASGATLVEAQKFLGHAGDYLTQTEEEQPEEEEEQPKEPDPTFLSETGAALAGGVAQAVESVGGFAELTGDTLKTGMNALLGTPIDETQNPFSNEYIDGDANWLDIPDEWVPENKTGLGKFSRDVVEFIALGAATGGIGGTALKATRLGTRALAAARAAGATAQTTRRIKFFGKGAKILGDGAAAELISDSSEEANLMNSVEEHIPWASSWVSNALAVQEEENPWASRLKTVLVGAGLNGAANRVGAFFKGRYAGFKALKEGKTPDEADAIANEVAEAEYTQLSLFGDEAADDMAKLRYAEGRGVSTKDPREEYLKKHLSADELAARAKQEADNSEQLLQEIDEQLAAAKEAGDKTLQRRLNKTRKGVVQAIENKVDYDEIADQRGKSVGDEFDYSTGQSAEQAAEAAGREPEAFNNPEKFDANEKATIPKEENATARNLQESVADLRTGGEGKSGIFAESEANLLKMARGDKNIYEYIKDVSEDISAAMLKSNDMYKDIRQAPSFRQIQSIILRQTAELTSMIDEGGDIAARFAQHFAKDKNARVYMDDGQKIVTASPAQKAALQLTIHTLAKRAQGIATGAIHHGDNISINRQAEMVFEAMRVALVEHKKMGYMWGLDGRYQQVGVIPKQVATVTKQNIDQMTKEVNEYIDELVSLTSKGRMDDVKFLLEAQSMTNNVRTLEQLHDFIRAKLYGGVMNGVKIRGEFRKQVQSTFYNSILSAPITPVKAIVGTNFIAMLRPLQTYLGATLKGDKKTAVIAAAEWDAIGRSLGESWQMAKHNWEQGYHRKAQSYDMKYDVGEDLKEWRKLKEYFDHYGTPKDKMVYGLIDRSVNFNTHAGVKYSQILMGSGDAFARTVIGRMQMRAMAAKKVIDEGADLDNVVELSRKIDEEFRNAVFTKNREGRYIVSDAAARMAGDEAAMTRQLEGSLQGLERLSDNPLLRAFFPFVRTGFNALSVAFEHTPLQLAMQKHKDIMKGDNLIKYGIRNAEEHEAAKALLNGRMASGGLVTAMAAFATLSGSMTGNLPLDKETRDNWKASGVQPLSFKFGNTYISYKNIEPFNTIFALVADIGQNATVLGEEWTDRWMQKAVFMASTVIVDKSMLSGVEDLARLINPESSQDLIARSGSRYLRSHIPFAGLSGAVGDIMDANQKEAQEFHEMLLRREALFKSALPKRYDILNKDRSGKELYYGPENTILRIINAFNPFTIGVADGDPVKQTLLETRFNLPQTLSTYKEEPLNAFYMSKMQEYLSKGPLRDDLEALFNEPSWRQAFEAYRDSDEAKLSAGAKLTKQGWYYDIKEIFDDAKELAIDEFLYDYPDFKEKFENRQIINVLSKSDSIEEMEAFIQRTGN